MSAPAQKSPPAPVSTTTRVSASRDAPVSASPNAVQVGMSSAFFRFGRLMVTVVTGPSRSTRIVSQSPIPILPYRR